ncbi:MAG: type II/IV secretion system protein [Bacteroidales bacterium]|nr:type II/IV secretion system protein [Bacteroidales bacterium]MBN2817633.1 type II/IV secretion system protein [Bacteroidales bacterium]
MSKVSQIEVNTELVNIITPIQAWEYEVLPNLEYDDRFVFSISDEKPFAETESELEFLLGKKIELVPIERAKIVNALKKHYPERNLDTNITANQDFLDTIIQDARINDSSDIHFETYEQGCRVRIRIDGKLVEKYIIPVKEYKALVNKIKIKANLNIAEKRLPQDGRILYNKNNFDFDIRVSILPTLNGEKVVLRLLQKEAKHLSLDSLGMSNEQVTKYRHGILKAHGIVLISGPTGSGKTTTLYGTLKEINTMDRNILTIEDPIEYTLEGINQVQLKESIGLTFSSALRTFLRQDPDIIMLGEIRDPETAQMASRAALTGHLVFSTIHTNSALGIINRLSDMGVPSYLIASTLTLAVAQRLVRLLCPHCKVEEKVDRSEISNINSDLKIAENVNKEVGCDYCNNTGFKGRKAIYEIISIDDDISERIRQNTLDLKYLTSTKKIVSLADSAVSLLNSGQTSLLEVLPILISNIH